MRPLIFVLHPTATSADEADAALRVLRRAQEAGHIYLSDEKQARLSDIFRIETAPEDAPLKDQTSRTFRLHVRDASLEPHLCWIGWAISQMPETETVVIPPPLKL